jgi:hypothetical protein
MKIYLATWTRDYNNGPCLTKTKNRRRLISYFLFQEEAQYGDYPPEALRTYIQTGEFESRKSRR